MLAQLTEKHAEELQEGIFQGIEKEIRQYKKKGIEGFEIIQKLMKEMSDLEPIVKEYTAYKKAKEELEEAKEILPENVIKVTIEEQPDGTRKLSC